MVSLDTSDMLSLVNILKLVGNDLSVSFNNIANKLNNTIIVNQREKDVSKEKE